MSRDLTALRARLHPVLAGAAREKPAEAVRALQDACETLREQLAGLLGAAGAYAVLVRSLSITREKHPWLDGARILPASEECMTGLEGVPENRTAREIVEAGTDFLTHVVALCTVFLGEEIGLRPVRNAWPELFEDRDDQGVGGGPPGTSGMHARR